MKNPEEHKQHLETKKKVSKIGSLKDFEQLLSMTTLSSEDKQLLRLIYIDGLTFILAGEKLGFSEQVAKRKHKRALHKISSII